MDRRTIHDFDHFAWVVRMIIVGTLGIPFTRETGKFYCPHCRTEATYRERYVRNFLTIYFIPLIPLNRGEEYVDCDVCRRKFPLSALEHDADDVKLAFQTRLRTLLALLAVADGQITEREVELYRELIRRLTGNFPTAEAARQELSIAGVSHTQIGWYLRSIREHLSHEERKTLIEYAFLFASEGGAISDTRNALLADFPLALGISLDEFKQIIAEAAAKGG